MSILDFFLYQMQHNQLAAAAVIAAPSAVLGFTIRRLPSQIWESVKRQSTIHIRLNHNQMIYREVLSFLKEQVIKDGFSRSYAFSSKDQDEITVYSGRGTSPKLISAKMLATRVEAGYGTHFGVYKNCLVFVSRVLDPSTTGDGFKEHLDCYFVTRSKRVVDMFMNDVELYSKNKLNETPRLKVKTNIDGSWQDHGNLPIRPMSSVILPDQIGDRIVTHIKDFDTKRQWNHDRGLPHHTGIMLHGSPGAGKTSLAQAVSAATGRQLIILNLSALESSSAYQSLMSSEMNWNEGILLIEDIDVTGAQVSRDVKDDHGYNGTRVTLSTLLNSLDGAMTPDGLIVLATTNHLENLDPALRRPGRFDLNIEVGFLGKPEFIRMCDLFEIDSSTYSLDYFEPMSGATLRMLLLKNGVASVEQYQIEQRSSLVEVD